MMMSSEVQAPGDGPRRSGPPAPRRVTVVTGSRADYGLLRPVLQALDARPELHVDLLAAGLHLSTGTVADITAEGRILAGRVPMQRPDRAGRYADAAATGAGVARFARLYAWLGPDWVLVLGDRIEAFAAAAAASISGIRVAHLHGGDRAEGVADEAMRHAITKLAHLHLAATPRSAERIERMGEPAGTIHVVGSPAVDGLDAIEPEPDAPRVIVARHGVGGEADDERRRADATLDAVACWLGDDAGAGRVGLVAPNADPGSEAIADAWASRCAADPRFTMLGGSGHLPRPAFLAQLLGAGLIVGNSSAGLIEAPAMGVRSVNLGARQAGRERPPGVIDCPTDDAPAPIAAALTRATGAPPPRDHPYGDGRAGPRIAARIVAADPRAIPVRKRCAY